MATGDPTASTPFPEQCIRGLSKGDWISKATGRVAAAALFPDWREPAIQDRAKRDVHDGGAETSVNWEDSPRRALKILLADQNATQHGIVYIPRLKIDHAIATPGATGRYFYERALLRGNPFHGNLVFVPHEDREEHKAFAFALALGLPKPLSREAALQLAETLPDSPPPAPSLPPAIVVSTPAPGSGAQHAPTEAAQVPNGILKRISDWFRSRR